MKETQTNLIDLLRLMEGLLPAPQDRDLREQLDEQPELRHRFQQLRRAAQADPLRPDDARAAEQLDEQTLAAFLEERLDPTQTARVEQACWDSSAMLAEIVSEFRFLNAHESDQESPISPELAERLLAIGPPSATILSHDMATAPTTPSRRNFIISIAVVAALVLLVGLWRLWRPQGSQSTAPPSVAEDVNEPASKEPREQDSPIPAPNRQQNTDQTPENPSTDPPKNTIADQPAPRTPDDPHTRPTTDQPPIAWTQVTGLIARRDSGSTTWTGWNNDKPVPRQTTFATLPSSWGLAQLQQQCSIVLDEDTELSITPADAPNAPLPLRLTRGRIALLDLGRSQQILIHLGTTEWTLEATAADTSIGIIWHPREPQLLVKSGEIALGRNRFRRGRQVVWSAEGFRASQPLRHDTDWFDTPPPALPLPRELKQSLQTSANLLAELRQQQDASEVSTRRIAQSWSFSLEPQRTVVTALASPEFVQRTAAVDWMIARTSNDPQLAAALASLAARLNDDVTAIRVARWLDLVRSQQRPTTAFAAQLVRALAHERLPIRHIGDECLRRSTGMQTTYRADAPAADRRRGIDQWTRLLRRLRGRN